MEKEPRHRAAALDCETLPTLESPGLEHLTTTTSAHAAEKAVNLLILAVVRLERALQQVHPLTIRRGKHTRDYTGGNPGRQASLRLRWTESRVSPGMDKFFPHLRPIWGHRGLYRFRATFARLSSNKGVHIAMHSLSPNPVPLGIPTHSFSPRLQEVIQNAPYLFPKSAALCEYNGRGLLITPSPSDMMSRAARPLSPRGGGRNRLTSFYTQLVDNAVYNVLILVHISGLFRRS
jgi:hypothetical protein